MAGEHGLTPASHERTVQRSVRPEAKVDDSTTGPSQPGRSTMWSVDQASMTVNKMRLAFVHRDG